MTRAEIRRHALAIAAIRKGGYARANHLKERARYERGYGTLNDFVQGRVLGVSENSVSCYHGAVDQVFAVHERSGRLPRGSWS